MKIQLDKFQQEILEYEGDLLLCTGRRVGKTYILARKAIDKMAKNKNTPIIIVSLTEDQAMIIMSMALNYAKDTYPHLIGRGKNKPTMRSLHINGGKMIVRPVGNTGDGARGFEGGVLIVDEASRVPKSFWIAALPVILTTNGQVWMGSTPHGKQGYFWDRFNDAYNLKKPDARFKVFYISTEEVINNRPISESWTEEQRAGALRVLKEDKNTMSSIEYGQEYMGLFLDELRQYFPDELIDQVCTLNRRSTIIRGKIYSLGVDIARMGDDASTFEILEKINDTTIEHVENVVTRKTLTTQTEQRILELERQYDFEKIFIDAGSGSLGVGIFDHLLQNELTRRKITAINNRARSLDRHDKSNVRLVKEDLYDNLRSLMERGHIKLLNDDSVKASLRSVQFEYVSSPSGKAIMRIFGNDTHIAEGLVRAAEIAKEKTSNIWIGSIRV